MKAYIHSCHATLEYDTAVQFKMLGWEVSGSFDTGSVERPKVEGMTDESNRFSPGEADFILLHQCENFPEVMEKYILKYNKPVISHAFGQGCHAQHESVVQLANDSKLASVVAYSWKDYHTYQDLGIPSEQLAMIRFGKNLSEYRGERGWSGRMPFCYVTCNAAPRRGDGCGWGLLNELVDMGVPLLLGGQETEALPFGLGQLPYDTMKSMFRQARCYLSLGTMPAPYTLSFVEAMSAGCPVIAYDNGYGVADEGFDVVLCKSAQDIASHIGEYVSNRGAAEVLSQKMIDVSNREFDNNKVIEHWKTYVERQLSL